MSDKLILEELREKKAMIWIKKYRKITFYLTKLNKNGKIKLLISINKSWNY